MDFSFLKNEVKRIEKEGYRRYTGHAKDSEYEFLGEEWPKIRKLLCDGCETFNTEFGAQALEFDDRDIDGADIEIRPVNRKVRVWFDRYTPAVVCDHRGDKYIFKVAFGKNPTFIEGVNEPITTEELVEKILRMVCGDVRKI